MTRASEEGQVTLFVSLAVVGLLVLGGLVVDGGIVLAARRRAIDQAHEAARAGAQALAPSSYRSTGQVSIDPSAATHAAHSYLTATGHRGTVAVDGDRVSVSLRFDQPMSLLRIIGIDHITVSGQGRARSVRGIDAGEGI